MKRRDVVRALLTPRAGEASGAAEAPEKPPRVGAHAVRVIGLEIGRLTEDARAGEMFRARVEGGAVVVELDPALVEPSFVTDRLARTGDPEYRRLVESMRDFGQQVPILARPHPDRPDRYQIAYGHRRRDAAVELGRPVKTIIRPLSDLELVVAQGKENAERRDLSFIERALFAADLERRGFDRATLNAALGVHTAEMTRLLGVAAAVPRAIIHAIGPAPKVGRTRWMDLARCLRQPGAAAAAERLLADPSPRQLPSDQRFDTVLDALRRADAAPDELVIRDSRGRVVARVLRGGGIVRISVDERAAPGLGQRLIEALPELLARHEQR